MAVRIYNTLTRRKEPLEPLEKGLVRMYSCGPTVYDYFHIGNARAFLVADVIRKYLTYRGYKVKYVQNITDIDDKIIKRANEEGVDITDISGRYFKAFVEDTKALGIDKPDHSPRATEHIDDIIKLIERLIEKGHAYVVGNDVFFDVSSFSGYGSLSNQKIEEIEAGARVDVDERKDSPVDFALWKGAKPGEPFWESPWGKGRPGWHIECSAMSMAYLGESFDIHTGGADLVFPHHENERAQSEAATGKPFVKYWVHNGYININGEKMSKSLGNFFTVRDILKEYEPESVRFFLLSNHYRNPINFSKKEIEDSSKSLKRLYTAIRNAENLMAELDSRGVSGDGALDSLPEPLRETRTTLESHRDRFIEAMDDDFNTAGAIGVLHDIAREINILTNIKDLGDSEIRGQQALLGMAVGLLKELGGVLGFLQSQGESGGISGIEDELIELIIELRKEARERKDWATADKIRDRLKSLGILLEDTPHGVRWRREG